MKKSSTTGASHKTKSQGQDKKTITMFKIKQGEDKNIGLSLRKQGQDKKNKRSR